jgi:hypothetical protein
VQIGCAVNRLPHLNADWMCSENRGLSAPRDAVSHGDLHADLHAFLMCRFDVFFLFLSLEIAVYTLCVDVQI